MQCAALAAFLFSNAAFAAGKSRIAFIGELDSLNVGQQGYCGARVSVSDKAMKSVYVDGDERVWFHGKSTSHITSLSPELPSFTISCAGDFSFVPESGKAYIVRYSVSEDKCRFELFRVVQGSDPVREQLTTESQQSCLLK
jgi:streptogramin lyase